MLTVVLENSAHLPAGELPVRAREDWNFATLRALPRPWINNAFIGWDGRAKIVWPDRALSLEIAAEPPISTYIVYSPAFDADFFCFEPVTHPVDAHNHPWRDGEKWIDCSRTRAGNGDFLPFFTEPTAMKPIKITAIKPPTVTAPLEALLRHSNSAYWGCFVRTILGFRSKPTSASLRSALGRRAYS